MRLLRLDSDASDSVSLVEFRDRADVPPYAILSHTWLADEEEVLFKDMESATQESVQHKSGYEKILFCAKQALQDGLRFFWIDTCCIDKSSSAELTEAINSMYRWYKHAVKCYVYLVDVSTSDLRGMTDGDQNEEARSRLRRSRWFSRGWTLQELLAPKIVEFYTSEGICLGDRQTLLPDLHEVTGVPHLALYGTSLTGFSIQEKMGWAANRTTKREEDAAYCLLGILAIPMVPMYGEGRAGAFKRLFREMTVIAAIDLDVEIDLKLLRGYFEDLMHEDHLTVPIISRDVPSNSEEQRRSMISYDRLVDVSMQPIEAVPSDTQTRTICEQQMEISPIRTQSQQNVRQTTNGVGDVDKAATLWTEAMARNLNSRLGYENVSVLLIKWADALDELKTRHEVEELQGVFKEDFRYHTEIVELDVRSKSQHQLNRHISSFIERYDGPHNLLVVYYSGHAIYFEDKKRLELMSSINPGRSKLFSDARINWNRIEDLLKDEDVDGDILTILDACYSSNIVTKQTEPVESKRRFQLMSACAINQTTASPGQYSFTRALIDALKDIVDTRGNKAFSTFHLLQRINMDQRRQDSPSVLWTRTGPDQHIRLAPLEDCKVAASLRALSSSLPRGQLTLRFNIRDESLNEEQIEYLATTLSTALHDKAIIGLRGIDWLGISAVPVHHLNRVALAMFVLVQWRKYVKKMRDRRNLKRKRI